MFLFLLTKTFTFNLFCSVSFFLFFFFFNALKESNFELRAFNPIWPLVVSLALSQRGKWWSEPTTECCWHSCTDAHRLSPSPFPLCTVTYRRLLTPAVPRYIKQCIACRRRLEETTVSSLVPRTIPLPLHYSNIIYIKQVTVYVTDPIILTLEHQITSDNASLVWLTSFPVTWHHTPTPRPDGDKAKSSFNLKNLSQFSFTELSVKQLTCGGETSQRR